MFCCVSSTSASAPAAAAATTTVAASKKALSTKAPKMEYASSCVIPTEWKEYPLVNVIDYNHDCKIFEFGLEPEQSLSLPVCACILLKGPNNDKGEPAVRPYTPISDNSMLGKFQLLVKRYEGGIVSSWLHGMEVGTMVPFKHIKFNVKLQYPFGKKSVSMLVGGTGITPMYQAMHRIAAEKDDDTTVTMLFGSKTVEDIVLRKELDEMAEKTNGRVKIVHILSDQPEDSKWDGEKGYISAELISKYCPPPSADTIMLVCGPPPMYNALSGPRDKKEVTGVLHELGFDETNVYKY